MSSLIKINNLSILNISLFFFPLSFILGNPATNLNFVIFTIFGGYYLFKNKIEDRIYLKLIRPQLDKVTKIIVNIKYLKKINDLPRLSQ